MRSSKSRSRSKSNRNRPSGNIINRVFDSSGPEGKVRGTPQQIIDKYNQLARDSQLSGDRVATENFQQHAEHYLRLLSEAQKEQDAKREEQERQNRERQAQRDRERAERDASERSKSETAQPQPQPQPPVEQPIASTDPAEAPQPDVIDMGGAEGESGLVATPEEQAEAPKPKPRARRSSSSTKKPSTRKAAPKAEEPAAEAPKGETPDEPSQAAE